jgi:very-short-patch-repair endonuclease
MKITPVSIITKLFKRSSRQIQTALSAMGRSILDESLGRQVMSPQIQTFTLHSKRLRRDQTDAERKLWMRLRSRQMNGFKFRRQQPIGRYIVDFFCPESKLVVELDGGQHADQVEKDQRRTEFLNKAGYRVLRFWDNDVLSDTEAVLQKIVGELNHPSPCPLPQGARAKKKATA